MTAKELLLRLPEAVVPDADTPAAVVQFETSEPVHCVMDPGGVMVFEGRAERADVTVRVSDDNLLKLFRGDLNPMMAMMTGKVKVTGNIALAQRLIKAVDSEKLRQARADAGGSGRGRSGGR